MNRSQLNHLRKRLWSLLIALSPNVGLSVFYLWSVARCYVSKVPELLFTYSGPTHHLQTKFHIIAM